MKKEEFVRNAFERIAKRYDMANTILSFGLDKGWRRKTVKALGERGLVLDLCAGTLSLSEAYREYFNGRILALDFSLEMLKVGEKKGLKYVYPICGDALMMPFRDESFDGVMMAFGLRNLSQMEKGLREVYRVLKKGGKLVILEFKRPRGLLGTVYKLYLKGVLPLLGGLITGDPESYLYLADSILAFPEPEEILKRLSVSGFIDLKWKVLSFGICALYEGIKA
jgi:demethylmenaquinone methyltransferase/2-methoxy-6-polyprenyl-1,4-benzoquinol methylase